ncbi:MAG TPA: hypothetical protein VK850_06250 [Candidatus Binatia bacterium]|nr:hypothetical protein [Candidatus Binatia bacterium]
MNTKLKLISCLVPLAFMGRTVIAQPFDAGSTGADGALIVTSNRTLNLPPDGVFNFTTINVAAGTTLTFNRNALNTPLYLLAQSNVTINGAVDVSGGSGNNTGPGRGGPGGLDGGYPGLDANTPPGTGLGPGGAGGGIACCVANSVGAGGYGSIGGHPSTTNKGAAYGSPLLIPLAGGSGGGGLIGNPFGGGGGGGAILIASSTRIDINSPGIVRANGGGNCGVAVNGGSGGAIRLVAPLITGNGTLNAIGLCTGGDGRIRVDTTNRRSVVFTSDPTPSIGANLVVFPTPIPRLDIVEAAGTTIPEGTNAPVTIQLPFNSTTNRTVTVQARDFNAVVLIAVALTPDAGRAVVYQGTIDNLASNPAQTVINVTVPVNTVVSVNAWTR